MSKMTQVTEEEWNKVCDDNKEIAESFLNQLHLSHHTLKQYDSAIKIFFRWVHDSQKNRPLYQLKPRNGLDYQNFLIKSGLANASIRFKRSVVSSMCGFVENFYDDMDEYKTFRNIFNKKIPSVSNEKAKEKLPLTLEEYKLICDTLEEKEQWQQLAFLKFTYSSGCRKGEVHQLLKEVNKYELVKDKDGVEKKYYLTHNIRTKGKGIDGKVRKLKFDDEAMNAIIKWLEVRGEDDNPYVFVNKSNKENVKQLSTATFNYWASNMFSKIIDRHMFVHLIRSTRATHIVVDGKQDIKTAQDILGHASSETTELYVVRDESDLADGAF